MDFLPAILITISLLAAILCIQPLIWQIQHGNIASSSLIAWIILANVINVINASIWPSENSLFGYDGNILCDIEVKVWVACYAAVCGCFTAMIRNLARILHTSNIRNPGSESKQARIREHVIIYGLCFGWPAFAAAIHYLYQPSRYQLTAIIGCTATTDLDWLSITLYYIPFTIIGLIALFYAFLTIYRIHLYRLTITSILSCSQSNYSTRSRGTPSSPTISTTSSTLTRSRFLRLAGLSLLIIFTSVPLSLVSIAFTTLRLLTIRAKGGPSALHPLAYDFSAVHANFDTVFIDLSEAGQSGMENGGLSLLLRFEFVGMGLAVFAFLGCSKEAWRECWGAVGKIWMRAMRWAGQGHRDGGSQGRGRERLQSEQSAKSWDRETSSTLIESWRVSIASRTRVMLSSLGLSRLGALKDGRKASEASRASQGSGLGSTSSAEGVEAGSCAPAAGVDMDIEKGVAVGNREV